MKLYYPYYLADAITNSLWVSRVSLKPCNDARVRMKLPIRNIKGFKQNMYIHKHIGGFHLYLFLFDFPFNYIAN